MNSNICARVKKIRLSNKPDPATAHFGICENKMSCPIRDCPHRCWHQHKAACDCCSQKGGVKGSKCVTAKEKANA